MIRPWEKGDIPFIAEAEKECFPDPWSEKMIEATFSSRSFIGFVFEENGELVGCIGADYVFETADILLVATREKFRKKGVATSLFLAALGELKKREVERVLLEVRRDNAPAIACYEKIGFSKIGERENYYGSGVDAIIMEKKL